MQPAWSFVMLFWVRKIQHRIQSYNNIKEIQFTNKMTICELFDIMRKMSLCEDEDKYVIKRIYEWGRSIHQGQIIPVSLIWYCLLYIEEDLIGLLHNQSELLFLENKELYERLLTEEKIRIIHKTQTFIPSYYNKA